MNMNPSRRDEVPRIPDKRGQDDEVSLIDLELMFRSRETNRLCSVSFLTKEKDRIL